jgi:Domain of unknown function (DUF5666)
MLRNQEMRQEKYMNRNQVRVLIALTFGTILTAMVYAQAPSRLVGSVTAISGHALTIQPNTGAAVTVNVNGNARILRTEPGAKTLAGAAAISLTDIAVGDRVLAIVKDGSATTVIAMKKADIAQKQNEEAADWQRRGAGGIVKSVDIANGTVAITSGARTLTIHTTSQTVVRRYSPDSAQYADSKPSNLQAIRPGDQLRVRGDRSADGAEIKADNIVAGSFRNIAGLVVGVKASDNAMTVRDLATKKPVTIHISPQTQMHKLSAESAQTIAASLKPAGGSAGNGQSRSPAQAAKPGAPASAGGGLSGRALSQLIDSAAPISLSALRKGDAVMIVATMGTPDSATAVRVLAGVEPILTASPSSGQNLFAASWSLGSGGSGDGGTGGGDQGGGPQ